MPSGPAALQQFDSRAGALVHALAAGGLEEATLRELEALRVLWRELSESQRAAAAPAARALAAAQAEALRAPSLFVGEDVEAERAIRGLDRIGGEPPAQRRYNGPRDPDALLAHFGLAGFRPGQREAVAAALKGRDSLVVMPTGGGKSLCYQLPGIAGEGLTIVVSPLIALMADQCRRLRSGGHPAAMIASGMAPASAERALGEVADGTARIVLCSPERFASAAFLRALARRRVELFAVDEAHCLSEWGHDFRPDYLRLRGVIERLGRPTVMACTATATEQVAEEIVQRLGLRDALVLRAGFDRPNLSFDVITLDGPGARARKEALLAAALADGSARPAIVYCGTRREVEEVAEVLCARGLVAVGYHAGMAPDERAGAQHRFMEGDADVVVATNAFGMGVDKADVRTVVHWSIPTSVEAYYQEAGRAGRDGSPSRAILLSCRADLGRLVAFIKGDSVVPGDVLSYLRGLRGCASEDANAIEIEAPRDDRERVCLAIAERAGLCSLTPVGGGRLLVELDGTGATGALASICRGAADRAWRAYRAIERFSAPSATCRRRMLLDHFGDRRAGAPAGRCCDVCDPQTISLPDPPAISARRAGRPRGAARASGRADEASCEAQPPDSRLLAALRDWRAGARAGKPAYTVAHNRTLELIAARRPQTLADLARISGVGPAFIERHGEDVLALVRSSR